MAQERGREDLRVQRGEHHGLLLVCKEVLAQLAHPVLEVRAQGDGLWMNMERENTHTAFCFLPFGYIYTLVTQFFS